ncbi:MAG TPA: VanW family protein, partial [Acidimicrobiia bacterium]|nr:VanW family protein [Acidimicrobiia bacterium]
ATFLVRALDLAAPEESSGFTDIGASVHQADIEALAASGITKGCDPPDNTNFCPRQAVTRAEMATFLVRALPELKLIEAPPLPPVQRVSRFTTYHDCCEPRVHNIQLIARTLDGYVVYPGEEFSINDVVGPRTRSKGYVAAPVLCSGGYCEGIGGGISQFATTMFNAIFWGGYEDVYHRPHTVWISRYPVGIEATLGYPSLDVAFRNDTVTPVTIRTRYTSTSITVELWGNAGGWQMTGYHPRGARSSVIDIIDNGGSDGRRVEGRVYGTVASDGGYVRVERTITEHGESDTETWGWSYRSG